MKHFNIFIIITYFLITFSCISTSTSSKLKYHSNLRSTVHISKDYVLFNIFNYGKSMSLHPMEFAIDKFDSSSLKWIEIATEFDCPCNALCHSPFITLRKNSTTEIKWNRRNKFYENRSENLPYQNCEYSGIGKFRFVIRINKYTIPKDIYIKEFELSND